MKVLVLKGGPDAERDVSLKSGSMVAAALRRAGCEVVEAAIERPDAAALAALEGEVIFPALHGPWGEGGPLQELLEADGRPFVGCRARAAKLAMDKLATKTIARRIGVPTPPSRDLTPGDRCDLAPPLVLKPIDDGSTVDVLICRTESEVREGLSALMERRERPRRRVMAERFIEGREITVGWALDRILPVIEIVPAEGFYDYEAKYLRDDTEYVADPHRAESWANTRSRRTPLPAAIVERASADALRLIEALGARDVARVDFMVDDDGAWLLEVNTMPGFTDHSLVPKAAAHAGLSFPELCRGLVERAALRGREAHGTPSRNQPPHGPGDAGGDTTRADADRGATLESR
ncbi:MAG: D-alanine--D-alanine ligase [Phycisphaerae bacterium]|nr:D-alanine--D-alanine ligase [Phycisphaerae bacterium]